MNPRAPWLLAPSRIIKAADFFNKIGAKRPSDAAEISIPGAEFDGSPGIGKPHSGIAELVTTPRNPDRTNNAPSIEPGIFSLRDRCDHEKST
jgi:hypothetical protein